MAIAGGQDPSVTRARAREVVVEHAVTIHPERLDEAVENFETWIHVGE